MMMIGDPGMYTYVVLVYIAFTAYPNPTNAPVNVYIYRMNEEKKKKK